MADTTPPLIATRRLQLRPLALADAALILRLLNQPGFLRHIGDKGVHALGQAEAYLRDGPLASYARHGFGLWRVDRQEDALPLGMAGLLQRDWLPAPDLGYALFDAHAGNGYASEAAAAACELAFSRFGLTRLLAIVAPDNTASIRLLQKTGFAFDCEVTPPGAEAPILQFVVDLVAGQRALDMASG